MTLLTAIFIGLVSAAGAVLLPGMLNMSVVKTCMRCSKRDALMFAAGIVTIFTVQASVAVIGTEFLRGNPTVISWLKWLAAPILFGLASFFLYKGYRKHYTDYDDEDDKDPDIQSRNHYFGGISLAVLNTLAIPYFFVLSGYLLNEGWLADSLPARIVYILSAAAGAFGIFSAYAFLAPWIKQNVGVIARNLNFFVGGLLACLAIVQTYRLISA